MSQLCCLVLLVGYHRCCFPFSVIESTALRKGTAVTLIKALGFWGETLLDYNYVIHIFTLFFFVCWMLVLMYTVRDKLYKQSEVHLPQALSAPIHCDVNKKNDYSNFPNIVCTGCEPQVSVLHKLQKQNCVLTTPLYEPLSCI